MAGSIASGVDVIAPQYPSLLASRGAVGEVDQTSLAVPDVLAVRSHPISGFDRYTLPHRHVIYDKDLLTGWAAYQETLMLVPTERIRENLSNTGGYRQPEKRSVVVIGNSHRGASDPRRGPCLGKTGLSMRQPDRDQAANHRY